MCQTPLSTTALNAQPKALHTSPWTRATVQSPLTHAFADLLALTALAASTSQLLSLSSLSARHPQTSSFPTVLAQILTELTNVIVQDQVATLLPSTTKSWEPTAHALTSWDHRVLTHFNAHAAPQLLSLLPLLQSALVTPPPTHALATTTSTATATIRTLVLSSLACLWAHHLAAAPTATPHQANAGAAFQSNSTETSWPHLAHLQFLWPPAHAQTRQSSAERLPPLSLSATAPVISNLHGELSQTLTSR